MIEPSSVLVRRVLLYGGIVDSFPAALGHMIVARAVSDFPSINYMQKRGRYRDLPRGFSRIFIVD